MFDLFDMSDYTEHIQEVKMKAITRKTPEITPPSGSGTVERILNSLVASVTRHESSDVYLKQIRQQLKSIQEAHSDEVLEAIEAATKKLSELRVAILNEEAGKSSARAMETAESISAGKAFIEKMRQDADAKQAERILHHELLTSAELQAALGISRQSISTAVNDRRFFAILGPAGKNYYPAFYADSRYDRKAIERVSKRLGSLPGAVKYHFFTSKSHQLEGKTPLEALADGKEEKVLVAAAGYAER